MPTEKIFHVNFVSDKHMLGFFLVAPHNRAALHVMFAKQPMRVAHPQELELPLRKQLI